MDFTSTMKIIFSKFLLEQAAGLRDQTDCFTRVVTWYVVIQVLYSKIQTSSPNWTVVFIWLSSSANIAANREITKVMDLEKKETMKNSL